MSARPQYIARLEAWERRRTHHHNRGLYAGQSEYREKMLCPDCTLTPEAEPIDWAAIAREDLALMEFIGCQFFACDGPDHPPVGMSTCKVCWRIRELRALLSNVGTISARA